MDKNIKKKTCQVCLLYAPLTCQQNNRCDLTKLKCKQFMQENICLPHSWSDLSALRSQPQAVVLLSLEHNIESQVLLLPRRLITIIRFQRE